MASTLNAVIGGVTLSSDTSGALDIQTGGVNAISIGTGQTVTISNAAFTNFSATSANITTLTGTTFGTTATTQLRGASANITTVTGTTAGFTSANITTVTGTTAGFTSANITTLSGTTATYTSANITTVTGTTAGFTSANITTLSGATATYTSANITTATGTAATFTTMSDGVGNVRNIPSAGAAKTSEYTLTISDIGEFITIGTSGKVLVPNNTFSTGNAISVYNDTTGSVSINISTTTGYVVGTNTNRTGVTLATRGVATVLFINPSYCILSGNLT